MGDSSVFYRELRGDGYHENKNSFLLTRWIMGVYTSVLFFVGAMLEYTNAGKVLKYSALRKMVRRTERRVRRQIRRMLRGGKKESSKARRNKYENNTKFITDKMLGSSESDGANSSAYDSCSASGSEDQKQVYQRLM